MPKLDEQRILARATELYRDAYGDQELTIKSRQVRSLLTALVEALNVEYEPLAPERINQMTLPGVR
jgi:hypothetical protein